MGQKYDSKELELAETLFIRDIESRVFQTIALQTLSQIEGVSMVEGNLIDSFLGRDGPDRVKGIFVEQDQKNSSVKLRLEVNVAYGIPLPEKAEEIQNNISKEVSRLTGLHVGSIHVVFKNLIIPIRDSKQLQLPEARKEIVEEVEYSEDFS